MEPINAEGPAGLGHLVTEQQAPRTGERENKADEDTAGHAVKLSSYLTTSPGLVSGSPADCAGLCGLSH